MGAPAQGAGRPVHGAGLRQADCLGFSKGSWRSAPHEQHLAPTPLGPLGTHRMQQTGPDPQAPWDGAREPSHSHPLQSGLCQGWTGIGHPKAAARGAPQPPSAQAQPREAQASGAACGSLLPARRCSTLGSPRSRPQPLPCVCPGDVAIAARPLQPCDTRGPGSSARPPSLGKQPLRLPPPQRQQQQQHYPQAARVDKPDSGGATLRKSVLCGPQNPSPQATGADRLLPLEGRLSHPLRHGCQLAGRGSPHSPTRPACCQQSHCSAPRLRAPGSPPPIEGQPFCGPHGKALLWKRPGEAPLGLTKHGGAWLRSLSRGAAAAAADVASSGEPNSAPRRSCFGPCPRPAP